MNLLEIESSISGPKRPQDKILLKEAKARVIEILEKDYQRSYLPPEQRTNDYDGSIRVASISENGSSYTLSDAQIVIAAITSCTNTSNPSVMMGAGLLAKECRTARSKYETVGKDFSCAWISGSYELSSEGGTFILSRAASISRSRLRMYDLYW